MPNTQVRVVGSNFTTFNYQGQPIAFLQSEADSGLGTLGTPYEFIHTLNSRHAVEIATNRTLDGGTIGLQIKELWNADVWQQLAGLTGTNNIVDIFDRLANSPAYVTCQSIIKPPGGTPRGKVFHQATIVAVEDSDSVQIGALSVNKGITIAYTYSTSI